MVRASLARQLSCARRWAMAIIVQIQQVPATTETFVIIRGVQDHYNA